MTLASGMSMELSPTFERKTVFTVALVLNAVRICVRSLWLLARKGMAFVSHSTSCTSLLTELADLPSARKAMCLLHLFFVTLLQLVSSTY